MRLKLLNRNLGSAPGLPADHDARAAGAGVLDDERAGDPVVGSPGPCLLDHVGAVGGDVLADLLRDTVRHLDPPGEAALGNRRRGQFARTGIPLRRRDGSWPVNKRTVSVIFLSPCSGT